MEEYILLTMIFLGTMYIMVSLVQLQIIKSRIRKQIAEELGEK